MEKSANIFARLLAFMAHANIFIAICAASAAAYTTRLFHGQTNWKVAGITLGTTFIMYNTQQLLLGFLASRPGGQRNRWFTKSKPLLWLVLLAGLAEVYPLTQSSYKFVYTYGVAAMISLLYFMPFSNLRSVPLLKSFIIGLVWTLVCVVAPLQTPPTSEQVHFACGHLLFVTGLCVLFNIRDVEHDKVTRTFTVPVLYGLTTARVFAFLFLLAYAIANVYVSRQPSYLAVHFSTFLLGAILTVKSRPSRHPYFYLLAVDGLILFQSILGMLMLRYET